MTWLTRTTWAGAALMALAFPCAAGQSSALYAIPHFTINPGAVRPLTSGSVYYNHAATVGDTTVTGIYSSPCFQLRTGYLLQSSSPPPPVTLLSVVSRKMHSATPYNLAIDHLLVISCQVTVEPRAIGSGHLLLFHFDGNVFSTGAVTAVNAMLNPLTVAATTISGADVAVTLADVADNQRVTVTLAAVNGANPVSVSLGFLVGDVNNSRAVSAADISAVKANAGSALNGYNYRFDLNTDGVINYPDIATVKSRAGRTLP